MLHILVWGLMVSLSAMGVTNGDVLPGIDEVLSPEYFQAKLSDPAKATCREEMKAARKVWLKEKFGLDKDAEGYAAAKQSGAAESQLAKLRDAIVKRDHDLVKPARKKFSDLVQQCGPCEVAKPKPLAGSLYISDGACYFSYNDKDKDEAAFEKRVEFLARAASYPKKNHGFSHLLEFARYTEQGERAEALDPEPIDTVLTPNFFAYIVVTHPLVRQLSLGYYAKASVTPYKGGEPEFSISFSSQDEQGIEYPVPTPPKIYDLRPYGDLEPVNPPDQPLRQAKGFWHTRKVGYSRYRTSAQLPIAIVGLEAFAAPIHRNTIIELIEKSSPEAFE